MSKNCSSAPEHLLLSGTSNTRSFCHNDLLELKNKRRTRSSRKDKWLCGFFKKNSFGVSMECFLAQLGIICSCRLGVDCLTRVHSGPCLTHCPGTNTFPYFGGFTKVIIATQVSKTYYMGYPVEWLLIMIEWVDRGTLKSLPQFLKLWKDSPLYEEDSNTSQCRCNFANSHRHILTSVVLVTWWSD